VERKFSFDDDLGGRIRNHSSEDALLSTISKLLSSK
jgi:hypothetical protein